MVAAVLGMLLIAASLLVRRSPQNGFDACGGAPYPLDCYRHELPGVLERYGSTATLSLITELPLSYDRFGFGDCHFFMHDFGHLDYMAHPNLQELFRDGDTYCMGAYFHGVLEAYLEEHGHDLQQAFRGACAGIPAGAYQFVDCFHGLGHAIMRATKSDLFKSLSYCDLLAQERKQSLCYLGVFMENSYAHYADLAKSSRYVRSDDFLYPCTAVDVRYKDICYRFPGRAYLHTRRTDHRPTRDFKDFRRAFDICLGISEGGQYRRNCVEHVSVTILFAFPDPNDWVHARGACELLENHEYRSRCYAHTAMYAQQHDFTGEGLGRRFCAELPGDYPAPCFRFIEQDAYPAIVHPRTGWQFPVLRF